MKLWNMLVSIFFAVLVGLLPRMGEAASGNISTIVGGGVGVTLTEPSGVAVDSAGNLYIADAGQHRVYKRTPNGTVTTVAGTGTATAAGANPGDGGAATAATLNTPTSVAVDGSGNLYIADAVNRRVRKVTAATGIITTVAGNGTRASAGDGGPATAASMKYPQGVALDSAGNLYIADFSDHRIRKVAAATGIITSVAGLGSAGFLGENVPATTAKLNNPTGVAVDGSGNVFIADLLNHRVRKIVAATGNIVTVAGTGVSGSTGNGGPATAADLAQPAGVAVDAAGNLLIATQLSHEVRRVDAATGTITVAAGDGDPGSAGDGGPATAARLYLPFGVALDSNRNIYIADKGNQRIRLVLDIPEVTAAPAGGRYSSAQQVRLTAGSAATIYYTTDGSDPKTSSTRLSFNTTGTISVATSTTLKYYAVEADGGATAVATQIYNMVASAPTAVTATAGIGEATISFSPPAFTGGRPVLSYTVISNPGDITVADLAGPITVTGLTDGTAYTFSVIAETDSGWGAPATTNSVTPGTGGGTVYSLSLQIAGDGGGTVNGAITCAAGQSCQPVTYPSATSATLMASPDANSLFGGWSGACSGTGNCTVTVDGAKTVTATFNPAPPKAQIVGKTGFVLLSDAFAAAVTGDTIQGRALDFVENIVLDQKKNLTFKGGYDESFSTASGTTKVDGKLTIRDGQLRVDKLIVK